MKRLAAVLTIVVFLFTEAGATVAQPMQAASGPFRIAKIKYAQGSTLNSEYVVVRNITKQRKNLKGFKIVDPNDGQRYLFRAPSSSPAVASSCTPARARTVTGTATGAKTRRCGTRRRHRAPQEQNQPHGRPLHVRRHRGRHRSVLKCFLRGRA